MTMLGGLFAPRRSGDDAERVAENFLIARGLALVTRNYHCRFGEIDLIMRERDTLVFVEVRLRRGRKDRDYGGAAASITVKKQGRIIAAAHHYLSGMKQLPPCRFDAVLMNGVTADDVEWLTNAFEA